MKRSTTFLLCIGRVNYVRADGIDSLLGADGGPGIGLHVAQLGFFPGLFGVLLEVFCSKEIHPAGMTSGRNKFHLRDQLRIGGFILHSSGIAIRFLPGTHAAR
jgi:hypothetical protein